MRFSFAYKTGRFDHLPWLSSPKVLLTWLLFFDCHSDLPLEDGLAGCSKSTPFAAGVTFSRVGSLFHFGMPISVSPLLRKTARLFFFVFVFFLRKGKGAKHCQGWWAVAHVWFHSLGGWGGQLCSPLWALQVMLMQEHSYYKQETRGARVSPGPLQISSLQQVGMRWWVGQWSTVLLELFPEKLFEQGILKLKECLWQERRGRQKFLGALEQRVFVSRDLHSWWDSLQQ